MSFTEGSSEKRGELGQSDQSVSGGNGIATCYQAYDRGITKSTDIHICKVCPTLLMYSDNPHGVTRPCSQNFLEILLSDLTAVRNAYKLEYKETSRSAAKACLEKIFEECNRMVIAPELFVSEGAAVQFFGSIELLSAQIVDIIACWKRRERLQKEHLKSLAERYQTRSRHHYRNGYKPWQQFLSSSAAGSGTGIHAPNPSMSSQIIPWAGVRLLSNWSKECRQIINFIEEVSVPAPESPRKKQAISRTVADF